jgi:hypothetical protein
LQDRRRERKNTSLSIVSSPILHLLAVSIWAAALKSRSTAAELGRVELAFLNASATGGYEVKLSTDADFEVR